MREEGGFQPSAESGEESGVVLAAQAEKFKEDFCAAERGFAKIVVYRLLVAEEPVFTQGDITCVSGAAALVGVAVVDTFQFFITRHNLRVAVVIHNEDLDIFALGDGAEQSIQQIGDVLMRDDDAITDRGHGVCVRICCKVTTFF